MKDGNINFIGSSAENQGVTAKIGNTEYLHPAGTITVSYNGNIGEAFYQTEWFWASDDINVLYPKFNMTEYTALFLISVIKPLKSKYSYTHKWVREEMEKDEILLPVDSNGAPDWGYMEEYMKQMEEDMKKELDVLTSLQ